MLSYGRGCLFLFRYFSHNAWWGKREFRPGKKIAVRYHWIVCYCLWIVMDPCNGKSTTATTVRLFCFLFLVSLSRVWNFVSWRRGKIGKESWFAAARTTCWFRDARADLGMHVTGWWSRFTWAEKIQRGTHVASSWWAKQRDWLRASATDQVVLYFNNK